VHIFSINQHKVGWKWNSLSMAHSQSFHQAYNKTKRWVSTSAFIFLFLFALSTFIIHWIDFVSHMLSINHALSFINLIIPCFIAFDACFVVFSKMSVTLLHYSQSVWFGDHLSDMFLNKCDNVKLTNKINSKKCNSILRYV